MNEKSLTIYLREIMKFKIPGAEEERELIRQLQAGDATARDHLIVRHLQSAVKIARLYETSGVMLGDLIDEGNLGLIRAIKSYDLRKGVRFISYASWWIKHHIHRAIYRQLRIVHIPIQKLTSRKVMRRMENTLTQELGRLPSTDEIAEALGVSPHEVHQAMELVQNDLSLDARLGREDVSLLDFLKASPERLEDRVVRKLLAGELQARMDELSDTEKLTLRLRFGLAGEPRRKLREIGEMLNLSRERIRQIEEKALARLRKKAQ
jgi:RNA polymerase primary sigma factor